MRKALRESVNRAYWKYALCEIDTTRRIHLGPDYITLSNHKWTRTASSMRRTSILYSWPKLSSPHKLIVGASIAMSFRDFFPRNYKTHHKKCIQPSQFLLFTANVRHWSHPRNNLTVLAYPVPICPFSIWGPHPFSLMCNILTGMLKKWQEFYSL